MRNIKLLVRVVKDIRLKVSDFITIDKNSKTKLNEFYQKILSGDISTDEEASSYFYDSDPSNSSYKNLKSTLKTRLLNTLFFWDSFEKFSDREKALLYCTKYMAASEMLIYLGVRGIGIEVCQKVLKKTLHFGFTDITIRALRSLRSHSAIRVGDLNSFNNYNELLNYHAKMREVELKANEYYLLLMIPYVRNKAIKMDTHNDAKKFFYVLKPYLDQFNSPYFHYITRYIESLIHLSINDYVKTKEVCDRAIKYFDSQPYVYKTANKSFMHQIVLCCIQLKMFEEGEEMIEKGSKIIREGTFNWYTTLNLYLTLAFHSKRYQEAYVIYNKAINHRKFKQRKDRVKERWRIFEIYLHFLVYIDKIKVHHGDERFNNIKMGRFVNSVPIFSKDKRGMNIPILIIQILFTIVRKDYAKAIDRIEAIEKYCSRYLKKDDNFRSNCFIKMLLQIPIAQFHKVAIERKTTSLFQQLKGNPLQVANQPHEIEIIPYEDLWELILSFLGTKFYKPRN